MKNILFKLMFSHRSQKRVLTISAVTCLLAPLLRQTRELQSFFDYVISSSSPPVIECPNKKLWGIDNEHGRRIWAQVDSRRHLSSLVDQNQSDSDIGFFTNTSTNPNRNASSYSSMNSSSIRRELLVVVPGLGDPNRINTTLRSVQSISSTLKSGHHGFGCIVYVYKAEILSESERRLGDLCQVIYNEGMWTHHMKRVPSPLPETNTHVAILMDDIDVTEIPVPDFLSVMDQTGFGVASPAVKDAPCMEGRCKCVYHRTDFVNILFTVFTKPVWECWQHHVDPVNNPFGWGLDLMVNRLCNVSSGIIDVYEAFHYSTGSLYNRDKAHQEMLEFIYNKTGAEDPQSSYECAVLHRPKAFEECLLYWDGSEAINKTVDWDCFRNETVLEEATV